ncbi:CotH kinase family protein [Hyalangium sp.]|uniref:CotH kinase family protein n=1 Tax=Hyalangium sp. TaxID=2028555 RepID=UPI002D619013|nr:CotH kinase family protein [Hyalangium sp.]HYI02373.1 CotH kinase family protein [Hyalangium sp.]
MRLSRLLLASCLTVLFACQAPGPGPTPPIEEDTTPIGEEYTPPVDPPVSVPPVTPPEEKPPPVIPPEEKPPELPPPEAQRPFVLPPVQTSVPEYALIMPDAVLQKFLADPEAPEEDAVFRASGVSYNVKVRLRGASARYFPKKSWNVNFAKGVRFEGRTSLNLVAEYADATLLGEKIAYDVLAAMRVPAPSTKFVRVTVNGVYQGPFLDIEQVNKAFLEAHEFSDDDATIYRCGWKDSEFKTWKVPYQGKWQKKTNEKEPDTELHEVLALINHTPEPLFASTLEQHLEVEWFLRSMVMDALMANDYVEDSESYFIHDEVTGRWVYVPWDLNNVDARWWYPLPVGERPIYEHTLFPFTITDGWTQKMYDRRKSEYPGYLPVFSNLGSRVVLNRELRARLETYLHKALDEFFKPEVMNPYIDALHAVVAPHMRDDPYMDYDKFVAGRTFMQDFVTLRRRFIYEELNRFAAKRPGLVIEQFDPRQGFIVLGNRSNTSVSLGGKILTTNLRVSLTSLVSRPTATVLPEVTLGPGESRRFTASELGLRFADRGEIGVFNGVNVVGYFDVLFYGPLPDGQRYVRGEQGWETR